MKEYQKTIQEKWAEGGITILRKPETSGEWVEKSQEEPAAEIEKVDKENQN